MITRIGKLKERTSLLVIAFLVLLLFGCSPTFGSRAAQPASAQAAAAGNVNRGRDLFMGYVHFQNDGPPCMGCHSVGNNGLLGGGSMGPDLTNVSAKTSPAGLNSILSNTGPNISPVMKPIYTRHPLAVSEQADLIAFLTASNGQPETDKEPIVIGISLAGFVAATALLGFLYRGRMRGARGPLIKKAQETEL